MGDADRTVLTRMDCALVTEEADDVARAPQRQNQEKNIGEATKAKYISEEQQLLLQLAATPPVCQGTETLLPAALAERAKSGVQ